MAANNEGDAHDASETPSTQSELHSRSSVPSCVPVEVLVPPVASTSVTEAKWGTVLSLLPQSTHDRETHTHQRRLLYSRRARNVSKYYQKLKMDEMVLKEAERLKTQEEDEGQEDEVLLQARDEIVEVTVTERAAEEKEEEKEEKRIDRTVAEHGVACFNCRWKKKVKISVETAARLSLAANFLLFFIKLAASIQSGSLSVISSLIDSALDLFSGATIATASYLMHHYNSYHYPIGRNRLEPVAIIITAAVMGTASLQIVTKAIEDTISGSIDPQINAFSGSIIGLTILMKGLLFLLCFRVNSASVKALATDHRNDVASNLVALVFGLLGTYTWKYFDPLGAILLALYIIFNWVAVGREQLRNLVGYWANRRFTSKLIYIAMQHSVEIVKIDTVRAYTFGINYLVELHIVLSPDMPLERAHDIGESLQLKLESMKEVERAFVHLDFESEHAPTSEHILSTPDD